MKHVKGSRLMGAIGAILALALSARPIAAQTATTGILSGAITDQQGGALPGVSVTATHTATGTKYETVTGADGRYEIPNVRIGGYSVAAVLSGFKDQTEPNVNVALGENRSVDLKMTLATLTESVTVIGAAQVIDTTRRHCRQHSDRGDREPADDLAQCNRRRAHTPSSTRRPSATRRAWPSRWPPRSRYNSMQIDGAVNNDLFGLRRHRTPGGQTGTQPISYDALQEISWWSHPTTCGRAVSPAAASTP